LIQVVLNQVITNVYFFFTYKSNKVYELIWDVIPQLKSWIVFTQSSNAAMTSALKERKAIFREKILFLQSQLRT